MGFIRKHPVLVTIIAFFLWNLLRGVDAWWSLYEKFKEVDMASLNFWVLDWIFPALGLALFIIVIWQIRKTKPTIVSKNDTTLSKLPSIAERQKGNPCTHLVITDRIWLDFKRNAKRLYVWLRIYYTNLGVNDLMDSHPLINYQR